MLQNAITHATKKMQLLKLVIKIVKDIMHQDLHFREKTQDVRSNMVRQL